MFLTCREIKGGASPSDQMILKPKGERNGIHTLSDGWDVHRSDKEAVLDVVIRI